MLHSAPVLNGNLPDHPLFHVQPKGWESIASSLMLREYTLGESVIHHGDEAEYLWLVFKGWVKLTRQTPDGKETIVRLCTTGDVFGKAALFAQANYPYHAEVISQHATIGSIPAGQLRTLVAANPPIAAHIMNLMNERAAQAQLKLEHLNTMSASQRLGCFLLGLCHTQLHGPLQIEIPISKNILASYLGMKPETFSRSMQQLKTLGITMDGPHIHLPDVMKLRNYVCNSCSESGDCDIESNLE